MDASWATSCPTRVILKAVFLMVSQRTSKFSPLTFSRATFTTPGPLTPTLMMASASVTPWKASPCKPTAKEVAAVKPDAARIALLRAALGSVADRAIIPMPDWLGLGAEAHLNTPGKLGGNWTWRAAEGFDAEPLASRIQAECEVYCRAEAPVEKEAKTSI